MRNAFADEINELAFLHQDIVVLSGDIGNRLFDTFKKNHDKRFYNCGVAEANMMGVAAGLGMSGFRPFVYTITPFLTSRCYEQIKIDVCYHNAPVTIVGTGSGLSYAPLGATHHSLEDIAIMRVLPNMQVFAPCDSLELRAVLKETVNRNSPSYIRIGKKGEKQFHTSEPKNVTEKPSLMKSGHDVVIVCAGTLMGEALSAARLLDEQSVSTAVVSMPTVKPLNIDFVCDLSERFKLMVCVEEHWQPGGFGSAIADILVSSEKNAGFMSVAAKNEFMHELGSQDFARDFYGLSASHIAEQVTKKLTRQ